MHSFFWKNIKKQKNNPDHESCCFFQGLVAFASPWSQFSMQRLASFSWYNYSQENTQFHDNYTPIYFTTLLMYKIHWVFWCILFPWYFFFGFFFFFFFKQLLPFIRVILHLSKSTVAYNAIINTKLTKSQVKVQSCGKKREQMKWEDVLRRFSTLEGINAVSVNVYVK